METHRRTLGESRESLLFLISEWMVKSLRTLSETRESLPFLISEGMVKVTSVTAKDCHGYAERTLCTPKADLNLWRYKRTGQA